MDIYILDMNWLELKYSLSFYSLITIWKKGKTFYTDFGQLCHGNRRK